jgi:endonuclease/exonuclease/phosphatase (EEP) superfamily protein YafD
MFIRHRFGWALVGGSLLLHLVTVVCFTRLPDRFAAFTAFPLWFWGGIGLGMASVAFCLLRARLSLVMAAVWAVTILAGSDEARVIGNLANDPPRTGPAAAHHGSPVLRVVSLNCSLCAQGMPTADLAAWAPDVVLLQEVFPHQARQIATALYQGAGEFRCHTTNATLTRWRLGEGYVIPGLRNQQTTVLLPDGRSFQTINLHLSSAATDLRFWQRAAWREHRANRSTRRTELAMILQVLDETAADSPVILGGDFNSGAADPVLRLLGREFRDSFPAAGTGWGDTFQRRVPILRIDQIHATPHFKPVRARAHTTRHSDHRMVIADFVADELLR